MTLPMAFVISILSLCPGPSPVLTLDNALSKLAKIPAVFGLNWPLQLHPEPSKAPCQQPLIKACVAAGPRPLPGPCPGLPHAVSLLQDLTDSKLLHFTFPCSLFWTLAHHSIYPVLYLTNVNLLKLPQIAVAEGFSCIRKSQEKLKTINHQFKALW